MSRVHRFGRSLAVASVALILVAGALFAHDAVVDPSTGSAPATTGGDDLGNFQTPESQEQGDDNEAVDTSDAKDDQRDQAEQGDDNEAANTSDAKDDQRDQAEQGDDNDDQGDDNDDQGEDAPAVKPATHHSAPIVRHHANQDGADKNDDHEGDDHEGDSHNGGGDSGGGEQDD